MPKTLHCMDLDLGIECLHMETGESDEEVVEKMFVHAEAEHAEDVRMLSDEEKMELRERLVEVLEENKRDAADELGE